jgi:DNA-binding transcriptional LysR family regulator
LLQAWAGQITTFQAQPYLDSGALQRLLPDWSHPLLPIYVVYPPNRHLSAKVRAFVDWAAELFASHPAAGQPLPDTPPPVHPTRPHRP